MKRLFLVLLICLCAGSVLGQSFFGIPGFKMKDRFLYSRTTDSIYFVDETGADTTLLAYYDGTDWYSTGLYVGNGDTGPGLIRLYEDSDNGSNYTQLSCSTSASGTTTFYFPVTDGSAGHFLKTNGSGGLYFEAFGGGLSYWTESDDNDTSVFTATAPNTWVGFNDNLTMQGKGIRGVDTMKAVVYLPWDNSNLMHFGYRAKATEFYWYDTVFTAVMRLRDDTLWGTSGTTITGFTWTGEAVTVPYGGTGAASLTDHAVLLGSGTNSITPLPVLHDGDIIIGVTGSDPSEIHGAFTSSSGTLIHEHGGLEDDVSGYTDGLYGMLSSVTADIDTEAELETALGGINVIVETEIDASAKLLNIVGDPQGTGSLVFSIAPTFTGTTNFQDVIVNEQLIADTITAALQFALPRGNSVVVNGNGEIAIDENADGNYFDEGLIKYWSGSDSMWVPAFSADGVTANDNDVVTYDASNDKWVVEAQIGASGEANTLDSAGTWNGTTGFGLAAAKVGTVLNVKGLIEGTNIVITPSGDSGIVIGGPAASGTADSTGVDSSGNGTIDASIYATGGYALVIKQGRNVDLEVDTDTLKIHVDSVDHADYADDVDTAGNDIALALDDRQDESAVLTDIADGTINTDLINEQFPWLDNEVSNTLTITGYMQDGDINTFTKLNSWVSDATLLNTDSAAQIDAAWTFSADCINTAFPWANNEVDSSGVWNAAKDSVSVWLSRGYPAATTALLGIASFNSDNFAVAAGDVTIKTGGVNSTEILDQTIAGDDIDSTGEDFVFDDAYRGTSAESDSAYATEYFAKVKAGDTADVLRGEFVELDGDTMSGPLRATYFDAIDSVIAPKIITNGAESGTFTMTSTSSGTVALTLPDSTTGDYEYVLPTSFGSATQQLTDNGSGVLYWANAGAGGVAYADSAGATDDDMSFDTVWVGVSPPSLAVANFTTTKPGYIFQEPDAHFGDADAGMIRIGAGRIGYDTRDTLYNSDSLDLGGTMCFRQTTAPDGLFEFVFFENSGALRFAIPKSGDSLGTWNSRSMFIAGPARLIDSVVRFDFWGFSKIDANTVATGADLGVQDDAEIMGIVYLDTIDNITAAPIEILADVNINGGLNVNLPADNNITIDGRTFPREVTVGSMRWNHTPEATTIGTRALFLDIDANSVASTEGLHIQYTATALAAGEEGIGIDIEGNTSTSTGGEIVALNVTKVGLGSAIVQALRVGVAVDQVIHHESGTFAAIDYAFDSLAGGARELTVAVDDEAKDSVMFDANGDAVHIGEAAKFNAIDVTLNTVASNPGIKPTFAFSIAGPGWTNFTPIDNTAGFREDGEISWNVDDLTNWVATTIHGETNCWIRITRTQATLGTDPIENKIQTASSIEYSWNSTGDLNINSILFEGATDDAFEHTVNTIDPTADRAFNFPDDELVAGDVLVASDASDLEYLNLASTEILIGDGSGIPTAASLSGDATMDNTGDVTVTRADSSVVAGIFSGLGAGGRQYWVNDTIYTVDSTSENGLQKQWFGASSETVMSNANGFTLNGGTGPLTTDSLMAERVHVSTQLRIPTDVNPTTDALSEIAIDADAGALEVYDTVGADHSALIPFSKTLNLPIWSPDLFTDTVCFFEVDSSLHPGGIEITHLSIQMSEDSDGSYFFELMYFSDADPPVLVDFVDTLVVGNNNSRIQSATLENSTIPVGNQLAFLTDATDIDWIRVTIRYYVKENN